MSSASRGLAPHEGLECLLVKMGRTGPLVEPRRGTQASKSGEPRSQNADTLHDDVDHERDDGCHVYVDVDELCLHRMGAPKMIDLLAAALKMTKGK